MSLTVRLKAFSSVRSCTVIENRGVGAEFGLGFYRDRRGRGRHSLCGPEVGWLPEDAERRRRILAAADGCLGGRSSAQWRT